MQNSIPKKIHYIWIGRNPKPESVTKCVDSWKKYCSDYEIIEWNEDNFDINANLYTKQAYENKKFAFVTDYMRLAILKEHGGIYMDSDVELTKSLDEFLDNDFFSGFENEVMIPTAVFGAKKNSNYINYLLSYYDNRPFVKKNGEFDLTTNVITITVMTKIKYNIKLNNNTQSLTNDNEKLTYYSHDYFCPKDYVSGEIKCTENTHAIHHFKGSWVEVKGRKQDKLVEKIYKIFGPKIFKKIMIIFLKTRVKKSTRQYLKFEKNKNN